MDMAVRNVRPRKCHNLEAHGHLIMDCCATHLMAGRADGTPRKVVGPPAHGALDCRSVSLAMVTVADMCDCLENALGVHSEQYDKPRL